MIVAEVMGKSAVEDYADAQKKGDSEGDSESESEGEDTDDVALAELGSKYMERLGGALASKDWPEAYKAFCRLCELHEYEEDQERGY